MQSLTYAVFIALMQISLAQASVETFEFGVNEGRVAFSTSGSIGLFEKTTRVPIVVPPCEIISYVRVDVDNNIGTPTVRLDSDVNTVVIAYGMLQVSVSSYTITAKTILEPGCMK